MYSFLTYTLTTRSDSRQQRRARAFVRVHTGVISVTSRACCPLSSGIRTLCPLYSGCGRTRGAGAMAPKPPWLTQNFAQWRQDKTWLT